RTAVGGILSEGGAELDADTVSVAVVRVSDPSCSITSLMLNISGGPSGAATMRAAVYEIGAGLALGDRIGAEYTVSVDESETGYKTIALDVPTPPGYYAIVISATEYMEIHGISGSWDGTTPIGSTILGTTADPALQIDSF